MQLTIHATPGARRTAVGGVHDGALRVSVNAPADKGKANDAILRAIADALGIRPSQITITRGATSRRKLLTIDDPPEGLEERLKRLKEE